MVECGTVTVSDEPNGDGDGGLGDLDGRQVLILGAVVGLAWKATRG